MTTTVPVCRGNPGTSVAVTADTDAETMQANHWRMYSRTRWREIQRGRLILVVCLCLAIFLLMIIGCFVGDCYQSMRFAQACLFTLGFLGCMIALAEYFGYY